MAKVLLVEDDNNLREIFSTQLKLVGHLPLTASNGQEGLDLAGAEKPDLIIADIMLPVISGFDMIKKLRAQPETKDIKVIIYSALGTPEDKALAQSLGVSRYIVKSQENLTDNLIKAVTETLVPTTPAPAANTNSSPQATAASTVPTISGGKL